MPNNPANLGYGGLTVQYLVFLFNLIFFVCGLILIIIGGIAQGFFREYIQFFDSEYKSPAIGLIIFGFIILVISFFGCCGARKQNVYMLHIFSFLIVILLICEVAALISIAALKSDVEKVVIQNMNSTMNTYENNTLNQETWDDLQENLECCGTLNYTDWLSTSYGKEGRVPDSCCKKETPNCGEDISDPTNIYPNGCLESLKESARHNLGAIIGGAVGIAIIQIIGIWMSCWLTRVIKENYEVL